MSYTTNLNLFKHNEPLDENENPFNIKTALNDNWDIIDEHTGKAEDDIQNLENILPKSTATGEDITLNNSADYKFNYFNNGGNTEQESYSGKNILNTSNLTEQTVNGVTFTPVYKNGLLEYINVNGTATAQCDYHISNQTKFNGNYILSGVTGGSASTYYIDFSNYVYITNGEQQFEMTSDKTYNPVISVRSGTTVNNVKIYPMLRLSTISDSNYEPYVGGIPSPNPDYPQKVNNVGSNVNLFDEENMLIGYGINTDDGSQSQQSWNTTDYIPIDITQQYCINKAGIGSTNYFGICYYDENKTFLSGQSWNTLGYTSNAVVENIVFSIANSNAKYIRICLRQTTDFDTLKIEEGTTSTGYTPYNRGGIDVKVENKNLFDLNNIINGYGLNSNNIETYVQADRSYLNYSEVKANTDYTISNLSWKVVQFLDENGTFISGTNDTSTNTFTTPNNTKYIRVSFDNTVNYSQAQIEQGSATSYIAHAEQNITIPLPEGMELCRSKDGQSLDNLFHNIPSNPMYNSSLVEDGWYKYNEIGKVVLDGTTEDWQLAATYTNNTRFSCDVHLGTTTNLLSNYFIEGTGGTDTTNIDTNGNTGYLMVTIPNNIASTVNALTTWLSTHNTILYYQLETPTYTQITDTDTITALNTLEKFITYQGGTNISSDNIPSPIFDVQYFLDLQSLFN